MILVTIISISKNICVSDITYPKTNCHKMYGLHMSFTKVTHLKPPVTLNVDATAFVQRSVGSPEIHLKISNLPVIVCTQHETSQHPHEVPTASL